ncbi:MAG TPA: hypothetical protein VGV90_00040 [Solirubrobacteraceae bacterium]|nr:hypothetical protein [Solirubrobacteraceae bacterium]
MIELTFLALLNRLMNWGLAPLIATRIVPADAAALLRFLSDPAHQLRLIGDRRGLAASVRPSASGRVITVELLRGERTMLWLTWILSPGRGTTEVDLAVQFETRGLATRLVLTLGGRRWLARRAQRVLAELAQLCTRAAEELPPAPAPTLPAVPAATPATECGGRARKTRRARDANRTSTHARRRSHAP